MGKLSRGVSVIGVSSLPQLEYDDPEMKDISLYEMWACACHQAMDDAGVKPKDIDRISYSQFAYTPLMGKIGAPVGWLEEWIGMSGKPMSHNEQACASGYMAFAEGVEGIASGKFDVVLVAGIESPKKFIPKDEPAYVMKPLNEYDEGFWHPGYALFDCAYSRFDGAANNLLTEEQGKYYIKNYGIDEQTLDDTYNAMSISLRRGAANNPRALKTSRKTFEEEAKEAGFDDVMEYMRSDHNCKITQYMRKAGSVVHNIAAGAIVLCADDVLDKFPKRKPIHVVDFAYASSAVREPFCFHNMNVNVRDQLLANGLFKPENIDLLITTVMSSGEQLDSAEVFGYLPEGEGYKYELEFRTAFDGDKPINPHGGDTQFGHSQGETGVSMIGEAIFQMRGEAGGCQVQKPIKQCLVRGMGGGHTTVGILLEND